MGGYNTKYLAWIAFLCFLLGISITQPVTAQDDREAETDSTAVDRYLELGTEKGELGGKRQKAYERRQIKAQILTFIPPLLRPAVTQHAYVLPPGAFSMAISQRHISIDGNDFFRNGDPNRAVFNDAKVERTLTDFDFFYGFDLDRQYLHGFTLRVNVPYLSSNVDGFIHPNGQQFISIENAGATSEIGDIGIFLKKKLLDQGNSPIGLAVVAAVFLPTGENNETFGSNGRVTTQRPTPPNTTVAQGFDALMAANVGNGVWGAPQCFFRNFNLANRALCDGPAAGPGGAFGAPGAAVESFSPGGANFASAFIGDFPFNNGIFGRFSNDGRLPSTLQPGTGDYGFLLGTFLTKQFNPGSFPGRSAAHLGVAHRFVSQEDGIDFGDTTTYFASFVKPVYKDYLSVDLSFIGFDKQADSYSGMIPEPEIHVCDSNDVANSVGVCMAPGDESFVFELIPRPAFASGFSGFFAPSLIFSPDPQIRITLSGLFRIIEPDLGPAPDSVFRASLDVTF